jgi:hypothetical protein
LYKEKEMEYIVAIAVIAALGYLLFGRKKEEATVVAETPKVEEVQPPVLTEVVEVPVEAPAKKAPAKKKAAAPKAAKAPAAKKTTKKAAKPKA